jgi:hypothetical protein
MVDEFVFEFPGPSADHDARDLESWLNRNEDLRGAAQVRMVPARPGEQGGAADAAMLLASFGVMIKPFFTWLTERAKSKQITVRVSAKSKGSTVEINVSGPEGVMPAVQQLTEAFDDRK